MFKNSTASRSRVSAFIRVKCVSIYVVRSGIAKVFGPCTEAPPLYGLGGVMDPVKSYRSSIV